MSAVRASSVRPAWRPVRVLSDSSDSTSDSSSIAIYAFTIPQEFDPVSYLYHLAQINVIRLEQNDVFEGRNSRFRGHIAVRYHHLRITGSALGFNKRQAKKAAVDQLFKKLQSSKQRWILVESLTNQHLP
jgi:hypothetical protein